MSRAVPPRLFKHKLGSNGGFHVGHGCRRKRVKSTKEKTEGKVNAKEKGGSLQIPLASPKEIRIKEKWRGHIWERRWKQLFTKMGKSRWRNKWSRWGWEKCAVVSNPALISCCGRCFSAVMPSPNRLLQEETAHTQLEMSLTRLLQASPEEIKHMVSPPIYSVLVPNAHNIHIKETYWFGRRKEVGKLTLGIIGGVSVPFRNPSQLKPSNHLEGRE